MPTNAKTFVADLRKRARDLPEALVMQSFRKFAFKVLEGAVQNTPVNTGRLRNGWHVTEGGPSGTESTAVAFGPVGPDGGFGSGATGGGVLGAGKRVIDSVEFGQTIWIQNNVPYARVIEDGLFVPKNPGPSKATHVPKSRRNRVAGEILVQGGFHVSAPNGMLADAVQQAKGAWASGAL